MTSRLLLLPLLITLLAILSCVSAELDVAKLWKVLNGGNKDVQTKEVVAEPRSSDSRQHKAFFVNYPVMQRVYKDKDLEASESRKRHKQRPRKPNQKPESDIYFIKLAPAPYSYIEGLGYISHPPAFSPASLPKSKPKPKPKPKPGHKPFVKVPIDFVSNGKPTKVYLWQPNKLDNPIRLNRGPYNFNGKPTGVYVIKKKPKRKPLLTKEYKKKVVVKQ